MSGAEHLPGTLEVEACVDDLVGGIAWDIAEGQGGVVVMAMEWADGGCACDDEPEQGPDETTGLHCNDSRTWCLRCQAIALLDALHGREPGETVLAERVAQIPVTDEDVLAYNPFDGDDSDTRLLADKVTKARKPGPCHACGETIGAGERMRRRVEAFEGEIGTFRWCSACCDAMARSWHDDGRAIERRHALRRGAA